MAEQTTVNVMKTTIYHGDKTLPEQEIIIIIIASIFSICLLAAIVGFIWRKLTERKKDDIESELKAEKVIPNPEISQSSQIPKDVEILIDEPIKHSLHDLNNPYIYFTSSCKYF